LTRHSDTLKEHPNKSGENPLEITKEDEVFATNKKYLETELKEMTEGKAHYYNVKEAKARLEKAISQHEI
jgi:hypothetical protein